MRSAAKNNGSQPPLTTTSSELATPMTDALDRLFTDDRVFATLTAWMEADLARLEERFAAFHTSNSLSDSDPLRRR
jgi:hypothetical protein